MNLREMRRIAISLVRDTQMIDAHFVRWINLAYRELSRQIIVPALNRGDQVALRPVAGATNKFYLPYDFSKTIAFVDATGRSLDPILSQDVRQFGEYNTFGSFVQFYEFCGNAGATLADSGSTPITIGVANRDTTVTASASVFISAHAGEWLLPLARNTESDAPNPEDYAYQIASVTDDVTAVLDQAFRGVLTDAGSVTDLATSYFEIRPRNTKLIRIWGDPGASATINLEYQRTPAKLANDEDVPEETRLSEAIVHKAIELAGIAYRQGFMVQIGQRKVLESLAAFQSVADFDKQLIHTFLTSNPMCRSYSQGSVGRHMGGEGYSFSGIRY